jgi:hypothetical protein
MARHAQAANDEVLGVGVIKMGHRFDHGARWDLGRAEGGAGQQHRPQQGGHQREAQQAQRIAAPCGEGRGDAGW